MKVNATRYNNHNGAIRWRMSTSVKVMRRILRQLSPFEILMFKTCDLEGQGHGGENRDLRRSIANTNMHKNLKGFFFALALILYEILIC